MIFYIYEITGKRWGILGLDSSDRSTDPLPSIEALRAYQCNHRNPTVDTPSSHAVRDAANAVQSIEQSTLATRETAAKWFERRWIRPIAPECPPETTDTGGQLSREKGLPGASTEPTPARDSGADVTDRTPGGHLRARRVPRSRLGLRYVDRAIRTECLFEREPTPSIRYSDRRRCDCLRRGLAHRRRPTPKRTVRRPPRTGVRRYAPDRRTVARGRRLGLLLRRSLPSFSTRRGPSPARRS